MNSGLFSSYLALWVLVVFQGLVILAILQRLEKLRLLASHRETTEQPLPNGTHAPELVGTSADDLSLQKFANRGGILLFLSSDCPTCKALVDKLARADREDLPPIIALCKGRQEGCARFLKRLSSVMPVVIEGAAETAARYRVSSFPLGIVVDSELQIQGYSYPKDVKEITGFWKDTITDTAIASARNPSSVLLSAVGQKGIP